MPPPPLELYRSASGRSTVHVDLDRQQLVSTLHLGPLAYRIRKPWSPEHVVRLWALQGTSDLGSTSTYYVDLQTPDGERVLRLTGSSDLTYARTAAARATRALGTVLIDEVRGTIESHTELRQPPSALPALSRPADPAPPGDELELPASVSPTRVRAALAGSVLLALASVLVPPCLVVTGLLPLAVVAWLGLVRPAPALTLRFVGYRLLVREEGLWATERQLESPRVTEVVYDDDGVQVRTHDGTLCLGRGRPADTLHTIASWLVDELQRRRSISG